ADGERAFLLAAKSDFPAETISLYDQPAKTRKSVMKMTLLVQCDNIKNDAGFRFTVRSPFAAQTNPGAPILAPVVLALPMQAIGEMVVLPIDGGIDGSPTAWPTSGAIDPVSGYSATFNSKAIPNWSFYVYQDAGDESEGQFMLLVDFSHSLV